ncbi:IS3 family transposase [Streptococcus ovuberis]|uniref:IS3 family transposase n=1 Tax=Streptococcus ovuberis TaxID=1936207 RepID=A0A7X6MXA5_9STRE|nr:IS3 family transposase [Streptococcus ovuberis]
MKRIFHERKSRYGTRKVKKRLEAQGMIVSRRHIRRIMKRLNLASVYPQTSFKPQSKGKNHTPIPNRLARQFNQVKTLVTNDTIFWTMRSQF